MTINRQKVVEIVNKLGRENPEFAKGLMKWVPFLCSSINKVSWVTGRANEDVLQDILVGVSEINMIYDIPLYRHKGRVYEKVKEYGSVILLRTPRNNKSPMRQLWVGKASISSVKKGKLESTLYREIFQQYVNLLNAHFTSRNGFKKHEDGEKTVVVRSGKVGTYTCTKAVQGVVQTVELVDEIKGTDEIAWSRNPEDLVAFKQCVGEIKSKVSPVAAEVLDVLVSDPDISMKEIVKYLGINRDAVQLSKIEIIQNLPFESERVGKVFSEGRSPVFMSVT